MRKIQFWKIPLAIIVWLSLFNACKNKSYTATIESIELKRGDLIACGPPEKEFGTVGFETSCSGGTKKEFQLATALLHSFEYDESEKAYAKIIDKEPGCAMAYWGVAMSNYHPLWAPPTQAELEKGAKAISIAQSIAQKSKRESEYVDAIALFYKDWKNTDHHTRTIRFEKAMKKIQGDYPKDKEAAIFYALALTASADPEDKSYTNQKKAASILTGLYPGQPNHPGIVHYIIHAYDTPELAALGLEAARKYASVAPSSAHALHMPSHIFTRLGLWTECVSANLASVSSAQCYAQSAGIKGHWDEELHGLDYLIYAYLQKGDNKLAKAQLDYLNTIHEVHPINTKVAYAFAAIPARYFLENKNWKEAATLKSHKDDFPWKEYPWQAAITHFARLLGAVHINDLVSANRELKTLYSLQDTLLAQKNSYTANQVQVQINAGEAWILFKEGKKQEALTQMQTAAALEDKTEKHPVTPCEVIPARELLGDLLLEMNEPLKALEAYETELKKQPNRFNAVYGAGIAAERSRDIEKASRYFHLLTTIADSTKSDRKELTTARNYLKK